MGLTTKQRYLLRARDKGVTGKFEDTGKYFYCANCGFVVDKDRSYFQETIELNDRLCTESGHPIFTEDGYDLYAEDRWETVTIMGCPMCGFKKR